MSDIISPTTYAWTVNVWINTYFQLFANTFMEPQYRACAVHLANAHLHEVLAAKAMYDSWGIPIEHAVFVYTLTYTMTYSSDTSILVDNQVIGRHQWTRLNYQSYKPVLDAYTASQTPPDTDTPVGVERNVEITATTAGAQTIFLGTGVQYWDFQINGLAQAEGDANLIGAFLHIGASYDIRVGDVVSVVFR